MIECVVTVIANGRVHSVGNDENKTATNNKTVFRCRSPSHTALAVVRTVAITTGVNITQRWEPNRRTRRRANNAAKHRAWFLATLRRQSVNTRHYSTRRSMIQRRRTVSATRSPALNWRRTGSVVNGVRSAGRLRRPSLQIWCVILGQGAGRTGVLRPDINNNIGEILFTVRTVASVHSVLPSYYVYGRTSERRQSKHYDGRRTDPAEQTTPTDRQCRREQTY